jgi:hypothetical protein
MKALFKMESSGKYFQGIEQNKNQGGSESKSETNSVWLQVLNALYHVLLKVVIVIPILTQVQIF